MDRLARLSSHIAMERPTALSGPMAPAACAERGGLPPMIVTLIAGGNSGHVCAALIEENTKGRVKTQLLTSRPEKFAGMTVTAKFPDGTGQVGHLHKVSDNPADLLPQSDIVIWTGPVNTTKEIFEQLRPHIDPKKTAIGTIFAQGLVHLLAHRIFGPDVKFFALRNIPWLCRVVTPGSECEIVGAKTSIGIMSSGLSDRWVKTNLEPLFVVQKTGKWEPVMDILPDFCPIVFNPANQIIHPARYWGLFRNWRGLPLSGADEPSEWLYRGMDEVAGQCLAVLDEELQGIKDAYFTATGAKGCEAVIPLAERLIDQYGDQIEDKSTMAKMVGTNKAYSMAKTPVVRTKQGVMPNPNHRVVLDDIGWGLCVLISIAERLETAGIKTPTTMMRAMVEWHQDMMGKEFLFNGRLRGRDIADLVLLGPGDALELVAAPPGAPSKTWLDAAEEEAQEDRYGNP